MTNEAPPTLDDAKLKPFVLQYSDLSFEKIIGSGANGDVYIGTHIPTKKRVAIKRLHDSDTITQNDLPFRREIYTLSIIKNPFLLPFVGFTKSSPFCIVTKFIPGGSLFSNLRKESDEDDTKKIKISLKSKNKPNSNFLNPTDLTIIAFCIAKGMKYLHKINIIHRDLKTQNILLDDKKLPVICDFGTSRRFDILSNSKPAMTGQCGTPNYMAPEFIKNESYDQSVDIYSYGVILWEMLTRETPYGGKDAPQVIYMILSNRMLEIPEGTPDTLKKLILACWDFEPKNRPTFAQIVDLFNNGEVIFEGTNRKLFEKTIQSFTDERKGRRPRTKTSSCEYQQTPVLQYMPSVSINNNNNNNENNNNGKENNKENAREIPQRGHPSLKKNSPKVRLNLGQNNDFFQFDDYDVAEAEPDKKETEQQQNQEKSNNSSDTESPRSNVKISNADVVLESDSNVNQQRPKIPKKAILNIEQRKNIIFKRHIAQLTTLYIRGIETGTDQQIRNSIAFIESHAHDPVLAKVEIWPKLLPVICNSISSKPGIVPALQTLSLRLAESPTVLASISTAQELHRFLRPETFDIFLYVVNFVPQAITIQTVKTLFTYSLPQLQQQQQQQVPQTMQQQKELAMQNMKLFQSNPPQKDPTSLALNINLGSSRFSQVVQNPFAQKPNEIQWSQQNQQSRQQSRLYADYSNASSNDDFMNYQNGGFGSFKQSILQNRLEEDFSPLNESKEISISDYNNNNNNNSSSTSNSSNNNNSMNKSGPSSMQIMSSQLSTTEKATILLCLILGQFQNNFEVRNLIIRFFVENAVNFANVPGGHLVLRTLLNNGLVTEEMFTAFSQSDIPQNIVALYSCIFSINGFQPNQNDNSAKNSAKNKRNSVPNYFTLSQILEHMLSIYPPLRNCAYEFIYRHGDHAANKPLLSITETLLKSIMMYHPNGTERAILLLCRIACDSTSNSILLKEQIASTWMIKMSSITAPPLMRLFVILFKDDRLRTRMITAPQSNNNSTSSSISSSSNLASNSPSISLSSSTSKHIHKYFENIAASNSQADIKTKRSNRNSRNNDELEDIKLNRMSALFLSNVIKNGDIQAFLTVCWVFSRASLDNEFVSILEDYEVIKIIAEKFNATKNFFAIRIICASLIQISKGFSSYDSSRKSEETAAAIASASDSRKSYKARNRNYCNKTANNKKLNNSMNMNMNMNMNDVNSVPCDCSSDFLLNSNSSELALTNASSNNSFNTNFSLMNSDSYASDTNSFFSLSTSSPSFVAFNDSSDNDKKALAPYASDSSARSMNQGFNDSIEFVPVLKKCSLSFNQIVETCLKRVSERNEASKECIILLSYLSSHEETHMTMMKANCIGILSSLRNSGEFTQQIRTIISNLKASGTIKNL